MNPEAPTPAQESRKLSNAEGFVKLAIDVLRYSPRWYLKKLRERPVATASLNLIPPTFALSLVNIGISFPALLGEAFGYLVGDQIVWGVKEGYRNLTQWWTDYKRR